MALLATPVLSRVYEPEAFGYLTLVVSVTGMITPAVALRLESALMLPRRAETASALLVLGLSIAAVISCVAAIVLHILFSFGMFEAMASLPGFIWWVGAITFLSGAFVLLGQFALRLRRYGAVALRNITQGATTVLSQLGMALISVSPLGLVGGYAAGRAAGIAPLIRSVRSEWRPFDRSEVWSALRAYRMFPLLFAPAAVLNAGALAAPVICAGLWFGVAEAGQWGMAERVLGVPLVVVSVAFGQVVEARLAHQYRNSQGGNCVYYLRVSSVLGAFSALVGAVAYWAAPSAIPFVLGPQWHDAALIVQLLVPMLMTRLIAGPMSKALVVAKWASINFVLDAGRALLIGGVLFYCWRGALPLEEFVLTASLAFTFVYIVTWFVGLAAARRLDAQTPEKLGPGS